MALAPPLRESLLLLRIFERIIAILKPLLKVKAVDRGGASYVQDLVEAVALDEPLRALFPSRLPLRDAGLSPPLPARGAALKMPRMSYSRGLWSHSFSLHGGSFVTASSTSSCVLARPQRRRPWRASKPPTPRQWNASRQLAGSWLRGRREVE